MNFDIFCNRKEKMAIGKQILLFGKKTISCSYNKSVLKKTPLFLFLKLAKGK